MRALRAAGASSARGGCDVRPRRPMMDDRTYVAQIMTLTPRLQQVERQYKVWAESEDEEGDEEGDALFCQREVL